MSSETKKKDKKKSKKSKLKVNPTSESKNKQQSNIINSLLDTLKASIQSKQPTLPTPPPPVQKEAPPLFKVDLPPVPQIFSRTEAMHQYLNNRQTAKPSASSYSPMQQIFYRPQQMPMLHQTIVEKQQQPQPEQPKKEEQALIPKQKEKIEYVIPYEQYQKDMNQLYELGNDIFNSNIQQRRSYAEEIPTIPKQQQIQTNTESQRYNAIKEVEEKQTKENEEEEDEEWKDITTTPEINPKNLFHHPNTLYKENYDDYENLVYQLGYKKVGKAKYSNTQQFNKAVKQASDMLKTNTHAEVVDMLRNNPLFDLQAYTAKAEREATQKRLRYLTAKKK